MSRRVTTAVVLAVLLTGAIAVLGAASIDDAPGLDVDRLTAFVDTSDLDVEPEAVGVVLFVAVLSGLGLLLATGPRASAPPARVLARVPVVQRATPARGPPHA